MLDAKDLANEYGLRFSKGYTKFLARFPDGVASFPLPEWPEGSKGSKGSKGRKAAPTPREPPTRCEHVAAIYGIAELVHRVMMPS